MATNAAALGAGAGAGDAPLPATADVTDATDTGRGVRRLAGAHLTVALIALFLGGLFGALQALSYAGVNLYDIVNEYTPFTLNYYQGLTAHGVLLALVFTTFFIMGFLVWVTTRALGQGLALPRLEWGAFWLMTAGTVMAALPILSNDASVLYTFYPPLKASPLFYIGLTLVVVGTWLVTVDLVVGYRRWIAAHAGQGERTPLPAFMSIVTLIMWVICSLGLAFSMLVNLIPWSLGIVGRVDPLLARTLFWFTGHAIVYFWLLPAYISWYTILPTQIGGRIFSDTMARVSFIFFLAYSIPVGIHHQYTDPGISEGIKILQGFFTFIVFFPSLLTAFAVAASLESVGAAAGDRSYFGWIRRLPWGNPSVAGQLLAMLTFIFGGAGGLVNASLGMNVLVHNTAYIVGHFHITVGTAVTQTFMAIIYWWLPHLTGRPLWSNRLALVQTWLWAIGMTIFSLVLHTLGIWGMPRRSDIGAAPYVPDSWRSLLPFVGLGGLLLFISGCLFLYLIGMTLWRSRPATEPIPAPAFGDYVHGPQETPALFDNLKPWLIITAVLIAIAYVPAFWEYITSGPPTSPGMRAW